GDVDAFGGVVEQRWIKRDDAERPAGIFGIAPKCVEARRRRNRLTRVERRIDPRGSGFLSSGKGFIERVSCRKAAGQIGDDHAKGGGLRAWFDCDGITHFLVLKV